MAHRCHARGCLVPVPPKMLMCRRHWAMVPQKLKDAVWVTYVRGQEVRKDPTEAYLDAAEAAILAVAAKERKLEPEQTLFPPRKDVSDDGA